MVDARGGRGVEAREAGSLTLKVVEKLEADDQVGPDVEGLP
jgi:hypothetical protein